VTSFRSVAAAGTLPEACAEVARVLTTAGYDLPSVYLLSDGRLRCVEAIGYYQLVDGYPPGVGIIGGVVASGRPRLIPDVSQVPEFIAARPDIAAEACAPVVLDGEVVGAINVEATTSLPGDVLACLQDAAEALSCWLSAAGGMPPVPLAQRLARVAVELTSLTDVPQIEQRAARAAAELSGMPTAAVLQAGGSGWYVAAAHGPLADAVRRWSHEDIETIAGSVAAGTSSHVAGAAAPPASYEFLREAGAGVFTAHPMIVAGAVTGVLIAADNASEPAPRDAASAEREAVLELLAAQTAACLGAARAVQELRRLAVTDPLTDLPNAAAFARDLDAAAAAARSHRFQPQACLLLDVDEFKAINDSQGHLAGDDLLAALAGELRRELRAPDRLYRIGGDEFAAIVYVADPAAVGHVGGRLLVAARRTAATVSIGGALVGGDARSARGRADEALYAAKRAGRDRFDLSADQT
jgi:diguanylate cyclase (GGDEF)-like protein